MTDDEATCNHVANRGQCDDPDAFDEGCDGALANLFSAFDGVRASDELQASTLDRIFSMAADADGERATVKVVAGGKGRDGSAGVAVRSSSSSSLGDRSRGSLKARWRAIRVAAVAACLALALTGGFAYATPASYYDVEQDDVTVTLGVNCFGITVSATSDDTAGRELAVQANVQHVPYEEAVKRVVAKMEERNPQAAIEFGPQGGSRETVQPAQPQLANREGSEPAQEQSRQAYRNEGQPAQEQPQPAYRDEPQPDGEQSRPATGEDARAGEWQTQSAGQRASQSEQGQQQSEAQEASQPERGQQQSEAQEASQPERGQQQLEAQEASQLELESAAR